MERERHNNEMLNRVGQAISARLDLDEIVQLVTDSATAVTGAQFGAFFYNVLDEHGAAFQLYTLSGAPRQAFERFPMPRATAIFAPTFNGEGPLRIKDVRADPRHGHNPPFNGMPKGHLPVHSYLAVPVKMSDGEVVGGLFFGHSEVGVFDAEAERLATGIAAQAAIALENARLYDAAQREIERRKRAFAERDRVARTLQASLLPQRLPEIPGVELAARYQAWTEDISGDFYDAFPLSGGRWGVVVGDVCGKGAEAAALTGLARYTVRTAAGLDPRPGHVLGVLNSSLLATDETARFCTAVFGVLTPRDDGGASVTIAHGGHPPALHVQEDGVKEVEANGLLLGAYEDAPIEETEIELSPGDALVLYTDGLTDVSSGGEVLGDGWLAEEIGTCHGAGADAIAKQLDEGATARQGDGVGRDDLALLVVAATGTS
jgi:serine phosphatase RsbU (regulator of sigma subunit)